MALALVYNRAVGPIPRWFTGGSLYAAQSANEVFMEQMKKSYTKPTLLAHGSVEVITGYAGSHDVFGGGFLSQSAKCKSKQHGPADFGS